jgi:hypothetical protein
VASPAKRKGDTAERELAHRLTDLLGTLVRRKLGAGRADDTGDLDGLTCAVQVKNYRDVARAIREGLHDLPAQTANAGAPYGVLFVRRMGGSWVAVMPLEDWASMYRETL